MNVSASAASSGATCARTLFSKARNWLIAAVGLLRSMDAIAAASVARSGVERDTSKFADATNCATACAAVMTSTVMAFVSVNKPSLTTNSMECAPTGNTVTATTPLANGLPASYHEYCNASPSGSEDREPSRITVALVPLAELSSSTVALASANGGWSHTS